jgi:hypothetical protein
MTKKLNLIFKEQVIYWVLTCIFKLNKIIAGLILWFLFSLLHNDLHINVFCFPHLQYILGQISLSLLITAPWLPDCTACGPGLIYPPLAFIKDDGGPEHAAGTIWAEVQNRGNIVRK